MFKIAINLVAYSHFYVLFYFNYRQNDQMEKHQTQTNLRKNDNVLYTIFSHVAYFQSDMQAHLKLVFARNLQKLTHLSFFGFVLRTSQTEVFISDY